MQWLKEVSESGRDAKAAQWQFEVITKGLPKMKVQRACTLGDGIFQAPGERFEQLGREVAPRVTAFVPASGAATRMFASLRAATNNEGPLYFDRLLEVGEETAAKALAGRHRLAIFDGLPAGPDHRQALTEVLRRWAHHPKGLVPFHRYGDRSLTAAQEQLAEAKELGVSEVVFTVPQGWGGSFPTSEELLIKLLNQSKTTDTIAVNQQGEVARNEDGSLLFRPGGHGALLNLLAECGGDLVCVKNIDNITHADHREAVVSCRLQIIGLTAHLQREIFAAISSARVGKPEPGERLLQQWFFQQVRGCEQVLHALQRPLRVAAMVPDNGAPGGGPYWVADDDGVQRVQIVEGVSLDRQQHRAAIQAATHFNPVDMVLAMQDIDGNAFDLQRYVDRSAALLVHKVVGSTPILGLEHPGLWNGAMAGWNTVFVQMPLQIFNPVKTVADLLRPGHQPARKKA